MPELPEVETIVRRLRETVSSRTVARVEVLRPNVVRGPVSRFVRSLEGQTVSDVGRRAKFIVTELSDGRVWLTHLRMSGRYRVLPAVRAGAGRTAREAPGSTARRSAGSRAGALARTSRVDGPSLAEPPPVDVVWPAYTRVIFTLDDGSRLLYIDPRTLGGMELLRRDAWLERAALLGPEPLDRAFTPAALAKRLATSRQPIKPFLLDQTRIAGIGNIYAAEALWRARVSPRRRARNLGPERARRLHRGIVDVLLEALRKSGTSLGRTYLDYEDAEGAPGQFYELLNVYDREGEPCPRCGTPIRRIVQAQRSTYYCPRCQR